MGTDRKAPRLLTIVCFGLIFVLLAVPLTSFAASILTNGGFELFQSLTQDGQPKTWNGYPERLAQNWTLQVVNGEENLHFLDSHTYGLLAANIYLAPYQNYRLEGALAQAFASQYGYSFVLHQTVPVNSGVDYASGGKIATFWKGPGDEVDHSKIFKRIGIDPTGGTDYTNAGIVWSEWDGTDDAWTSPAIATTSQSSHMTVFIQVENRGNDAGSAYINNGSIDNFRFERAPLATLNLPSQVETGSVIVTWGSSIPDPTTWSLWGYDVEYKTSAMSSWQRIQSCDDAGGASESYVLNASAGETYDFRVRVWQQVSPDGDPAVSPLPGVWVQKQLQVSGSGGDSAPDLTPTPTATPSPDPVGEPNPGGQLVFLPMISKITSPPTPTPTPTSSPGSTPTPTPTPSSTPDPSGSDFSLDTVRMLSITENGGCMGNHNIFLSVLDYDGSPLLGAVIGDPPENNYRVTTGDKNEPFFDWGTKLAEVTLYSSGTQLEVFEYPDGTSATSDQTPLLSTNTWEIPVEWLVEAGYCADAENCSGLLCQGHYSYWVVFQKTQP